MYIFKKNFFILYTLRDRSPGMTWLGCLQGFLILAWLRKAPFPSSCGFSSYAVQLRASVCYGGQRLLSAPAAKDPSSVAVCSIRASQGESLNEMYSTGVISSHFTVCSLLEASHRCCLYSGARDYTRAWGLRSEIISGHPRVSIENLPFVNVALTLYNKT